MYIYTVHVCTLCIVLIKYSKISFQFGYWYFTSTQEWRQLRIERFLPDTSLPQFEIQSIKTITANKMVCHFTFSDCVYYFQFLCFNTVCYFSIVHVLYMYL